MLYDFARLAVIFLHVIACCWAIGLVFMSDLAVFKQLLAGDSVTRADPKQLNTLHHMVSVALAALWITGCLVVALDVSQQGTHYFSNPKLQAKIGVVILLTINGFALHRFALPLLKRHGNLLRMSFFDCLTCTFLGAASGVSWLYAALLGVGRALSWKFSVVEILFAYPLLIAGGFVGMAFLVFWAHYKAGDYSGRFEATEMLFRPKSRRTAR